MNEDDKVLMLAALIYPSCTPLGYNHKDALAFALDQAEKLIALHESRQQAKAEAAADAKAKALGA